MRCCRKEVREIQSMKGHIESMKWKVVSLWEQKTSPWLTATKEKRQGPQSNNHKELNSANTLNVLRNICIPRASRKEHNTANTCENLSRVPAVSSCIQICNRQNCKTINGCCFKPLNLWWYVTTATVHRMSLTTALLCSSLLDTYFCI